MLKLYVWEGFSPDYTNGLAFAVSFLRRKAHQIIHLNNTLKVVVNALAQARKPGFKPTKWASYELTL